LAEHERKRIKASNTLGTPVKFPTKLLALGVNHHADSTGDATFVAEAGGTVSALSLSNNKISPLPRGPAAPLTSLAFHGSGVYAGCWDKSIWTYDISGPSVTSPKSFPAHQDFVKCLLVAPTATPYSQPVLISGGADGDIRFWTLDGAALGSLKPGYRGIECLALDPLSSPDAPVIFASTSNREIFTFTVPSHLSLQSKPQTFTFNATPPIFVHETSVYKIHFDTNGDIWTASADKSAKHLLRSSNWGVELTLPHPDFVRDVITHDKYGWVITACRDENIRIFSSASGDLYHVFTGHYEEVTGLTLSNDTLISISIDCTLRRWDLHPKELARVVEEAKNPKLAEQVPEPKDELGMLTEEEEAELKALMESEESETLERMALDEQ
jgi:WD40 repeat protein